MTQVRQLRAPNPGPFTLDGTNTWALEGVIIDPGPLIDSHVQRLLEEVVPLETILITHRHGDHAPAAVALRERSGARVYAPHSVLDDSSVDERLFDGATVTSGTLRIEAISTPGHTAEHFCFLTGEGDLFTGDTVLGAGTTAIFPPDGNMGDYLSSLRKLRERSPRRIFPGHGPVREDALQLLDDYLAHREMRNDQIAGAIEQRPLSIPQLRAVIYPDLGEGLEAAADAQLLAHLLYLVELGVAARQDERFIRVA